MDTSTELLNAINQSGGLKIQMVATQDWTQYWLMLAATIVGSIIIFVYIATMLKPQLSFLLIKWKLYKIKNITGRNVLIVKHTTNELFNQTMIDTTCLKNIRTALSKFNGKPFDLILHTPGGSIFAAQLISKLLKSYKGNVRAIIPSYAMSGGSFLALSCDEILLADTAAMGVIDPQLGYLWHIGSAKSWEEIVKQKRGKANDESIQMAFTGKQYSETLCKQIFSILDKMIPDESTRLNTSRYLTDGGIEHARPLMISDLNSIGIPAKEASPELLSLIDPILNSNFYEGEYWS